MTRPILSGVRLRVHEETEAGTIPPRMDVHGWIALVTLLVATLLFITRWIPRSMTALAIPVVLFSTGVLDASEDALSGFGNHALIAIAAIMVIGGALQESGVATLMARGLVRVGGKSEVGLASLLMAASATLAAFMNNVAIVAILLPVGVALSRRSGVQPARLLIPLSFGAVLGGTITLIGTAPNFLVASYFNDGPLASDARIGVLDFAPIGIPITVVGLIVMILVGRHMLPRGHSESDEGRNGRSPEQAAEVYRLPDRLVEIRVIGASGISGKSIAEADVRGRYGVEVLLVRRPGAVGSRWLAPHPDLVMEPEDRVFVNGTEESLWNLAETESVQLGLLEPRMLRSLLAKGITVGEAAVAPHSDELGRTLREIRFRNKYGLNVLGLWRRNAPMHANVADLPLELGDAILVAGDPRSMRNFRDQRDFVLLTDHSQDENVTRAPLAFVLLLVAVIPSLLFDFPLPISAIGAAILMVATGCIAKRSVIKSIDWPVLCLIAGTLPLGAALQKQGIASAVAGWCLDLHEVLGPAAVHAALLLVAALMSNLSSNAAAAAIMSPVAVEAAMLVNIDPRDALFAVAYGCSCNFVTPFAQCNMIVMGPGGYRARDFIGVGMVMAVAVAAVAITMLSMR